MSAELTTNRPSKNLLPELPSEATQLGKANQSLYDSEERFRLLVESVQDYAILMLDPTGNIVSWNLGTERIKGYTANDILGKNFSVFYPKEDILSGKPAMELAQATKEGSSVRPRSRVMASYSVRPVDL